MEATDEGGVAEGVFREAGCGAGAVEEAEVVVEVVVGDLDLGCDAVYAVLYVEEPCADLGEIASEGGEGGGVEQEGGVIAVDELAELVGEVLYAVVQAGARAGACGRGRRLVQLALFDDRVGVRVRIKVVRQELAIPPSRILRGRGPCRSSRHGYSVAWVAWVAA